MAALRRLTLTTGAGVAAYGAYAAFGSREEAPSQEVSERALWPAPRVEIESGVRRGGSAWPGGAGAP